MKLIIAFAVLMTSFAAFSQNRIVSIDAFDLSYTGGLLIKSDDGKKGTDDRDETTFRFNLNYAQNWEQYVGLMWKAKFHFNREDVNWNTDTLNSNFGVAGGLLYNFQAEDIKNSIYAGVMIGLERATFEQGNNDESGINFSTELEGGKRWDLGQYAKINISYAPSVSFAYKRYGGDIRDNFFKNGTELKLNFLKFDVLF